MYAITPLNFDISILQVRISKFTFTKLHTGLLAVEISFLIEIHVYIKSCENMIKFNDNDTSFPRSRRRAFDTVHTVKNLL